MENRIKLEGTIKKKVNNKEIFNLRCEFSILKLTYILKYAEFYLENDTGTMHLASIVGTKCLVLESARDNPGRWHPYGNGHIILRKKVDCEGCHIFADNCEFNKKCLKEISVEEVLEILKRNFK